MEEVGNKPYQSTCCDSCRCNSCLRSSPCASLIGLIIGLIGIGAASGGYLFARKYTIDLLNVNYLCPYGDYITYGLLGSTVLFLFVIYIINAFSTGWNSKHFFDSSGRVTCGRCLTMTMLVLITFAIFLWCGILLCTALPVFIHLMLYLRPNKNDTFDLSYYGVFGLEISKSQPDYLNILENPMKATQTTFICYCVTAGGALLLIFSFIQLAICSAMNYARFEEIRYFHSSPDADQADETHF